jgi:hypothetical protein
MGDRGRTVPDGNGARRVVEGYEPPRVEQVLAPVDLEREVLYAGEPSPDSDDG